MKYLFKMPGEDDYIMLKRVVSFRIAPKTKDHPHYRVFISILQDGLKWKKFKTKASAQNFCSKLAKAIESVWEHG